MCKDTGCEGRDEGPGHTAKDMGDTELVSLAGEVGKHSPEQSLSGGSDFTSAALTYLVAAGGKNKISPLTETAKVFMEEAPPRPDWKETGIIC